VALAYDFIQNQWSLTEGQQQFQADPQKAQQFVEKLSTLKAYDWLAAGADAYAALKTPELTLTLTLEFPDETSGGLTEKELALSFAPVPAPEKSDDQDAGSTFHYGRLGASPDVFLIDSNELQSLTEALSE
jgi:hypothetical protein